MKTRSSIALSLVVAMLLAVFVLPASVFAAGNTWTVNPALAANANCASAAPCSKASQPGSGFCGWM